MRDVIILHNSFCSYGNELYLSQSGVMDQVRAVENSLNELGIHYQLLEVANLKELASVLPSYTENIIFNLAEEFAGDIEQACYVPAVCEEFGKICTGNGTPALLYCQNKSQAKSLLTAAGIKCPQGVLVGRGQTELLDNLAQGRYILKPAYCDASEGISDKSVVELPIEVGRAAKLIKELHLRFDCPVLVEQFIPSRELNVAMMQRGQNVKVLAVAEIDFTAFPDSMDRIVDYSAKWEVDSFGYNNTPRKIPACLDSCQYEKVCRMSIAAWHALGCRDYARVDFRIDQAGEPYVIEVNPNPDISPDSGFAAALEFAEISYSRFVWTMISNALQRLEKIADKFLTEPIYAK